MNQQPSSLEAALLGLLAPGPASGYQLRKVFQTTPLAAYSDSPGAVYPALRRLEDRGLIAGRADEGGRRKRPWQLTKAGKAWLRGWIAQPVTLAELSRDPAGVDLRLAFVSKVSPKRLRSFLSEYASVLAQYHKSLRKATQSLAGTLPASGGLALELGVHLIEARLNWCRKAVRKVDL